MVKTLIVDIEVHTEESDLSGFLPHEAINNYVFFSGGGGVTTE